MPSRTSTRRSPLPSIEYRIDDAFADHADTIALLEGYAANREHPKELTILACARLDALANLAARGKSQRERFVTFVEGFSGKRSLLQQVAIPNLYYALFQRYETTFFTLETPGRIRVFDREEEMPYIRFLAASGRPLTQDEVQWFLHWFSKPTLDTRDTVIGHLGDAASARRDKTYLRAVEQLDGLLKDYSVASILYREVRSSAIHEYEFEINESRFFTESDLFVETIRRGYDTTVYLSMEFSARWLLDLLRDCLNNYKRRLKETKQLPHRCGRLSAIRTPKWTCSTHLSLKSHATSGLRSGGRR
jgi:hypothetical protein